MHGSNVDSSETHRYLRKILDDMIVSDLICLGVCRVSWEWSFRLAWRASSLPSSRFPGPGARPSLFPKTLWLPWGTVLFTYYAGCQTSGNPHYLRLISGKGTSDDVLKFLSIPTVYMEENEVPHVVRYAAYGWSWVFCQIMQLWHKK